MANDADTGAPVNPELAAFAARLDAGGTAAPGDGPASSRLAIEAPDGRLSKETAAALARIGVDWIAVAVEKQYPIVKYSDETCADVAAKAGAVLAKYDVLAWAAKWREEFELGAVLVGVVWNTVQLVKAEKNKPAGDAPGAAVASSYTPAAVAS